MTLTFKSILDKSSLKPATTLEFLRNCLTMSGDYLYRGQGDHNWSLVPSAFRDANGNALKLKDRSKRVDYFKSDQFDADFRHLAASGLKREDFDINRLDGHAKLTKIMLFQHFGIPTPLLDWTESPLVALFMATAFKPTNSKRVRVFRIDPVQKPDRLMIQLYKDIGFKRIRRQLGGVSFIGSIINSGKTIELQEQMLQEYIEPEPIYHNVVEYLDVKINKADAEVIYAALTNNGFTVDNLFPNSPHWTAQAIASNLDW